MNKVKTIFILAAALFLFSCESRTQKEERKAADSLKADTEDYEQSHANDFMNQSQFDELVQRFESADRESWQQPEKVNTKLGELKGKTIADLGAGTGYFTVRLAAKGANVIALDIDPRFIEYINNRKPGLSRDAAARIEARICEENDSKLKSAEVDIVFSVNTYHHISDRPAYFRRLRASIKPGGKLVIVDFKSGELPVGPPPEHKISSEDITAELKEAGYGKISVDQDLLQYQFVLEALLP